MSIKSNVKDSRIETQRKISVSTELALTTAGGLTVDDTYDIIQIKTVTGATVVTVNTGLMKGSVLLSVLGNAGGLTIKDDAATPNTIATIAGTTTGTYLLVYNPNATYHYTLIDYGA